MMTYGFPTSETGYIKVRADKALAANFLYHAYEYDDFKADHYINGREKPLLKFLVPFLNLEKVASATNKLLKAIFEFVYSNKVIRCKIILEDIISKGVKKVSSKKGCPLAPFLYHLYCQYKCLILGETTNLRLFVEKWKNKFSEGTVPAQRVPAEVTVALMALRVEKFAPSTRAKSSHWLPEYEIQHHHLRQEQCHLHKLP